MYGRQLMFLSHISLSVCLSVSLSLFSLPPSLPLKKINRHSLKKYYNINTVALASVAQLVGALSYHQKIAGWIPS